MIQLAWLFTESCAEKDRKGALGEVAVLSRLKHPCIVRYIESYEEEGNLCIVCEYAGESLYLPY